MQRTDPESWSLDLAALTAPPEHCWVGSGRATVHPILGTVTGVHGCFAPPYVMADLRLHVTLEVNGIRIEDHGGPGMGDAGILYAGGQWMPHAIERNGTYHHIKNGQLVSFAVQSKLVPLVHAPGFLLTVAVTNRSSSTARFSAHPLLEPGQPNQLPLAEWKYPKPRPGASPALLVSSNLWQTADVEIRLQGDAEALDVPHGERGTFNFIVTAGALGATRVETELTALTEVTRQHWRQRIETHLRAVPELCSSNHDLVAYYNRSLISGLVSLWEHPDFLMRPHVATSGMDGGALCTYLWDTGGYAPNLVSLMLGDRAKDLVRQLARMNLGHCYAMAADGQPVGVAYAYNIVSFVQLVWAIALHYGPDPELLAEAKRLVLALEERADERGLVDFGGHQNLLEMRSSGWEHVVVSPNAERAWCLRRLADLAGSEAESASLRQRADAIITAIREHLWDAQSGWFRCLHPDGHAEEVYSIQVFDALRAGACTPAMATAILQHLKHDGFLGRYGVSSVARADTIHYELNDPDWSGGGSYIGDPPALALTLYEMNQPGMAWDVLQRLLWMGHHFPYFPQETYADRPTTPANKRANAVSGLTGAEAVLFGIIGLQPQLDGSLFIAPQPPPDTTLSLTGYIHRGHRIDLDLAPEKMVIHVNGACLHEGAIARVRVVKSA